MSSTVLTMDVGQRAASCHKPKANGEFFQELNIPAAAASVGIPWPPSSHSVILDSEIVVVFSNLNDSLFTCVLIITGQRKWGDVLRKYDPLSS